MAYCNFKRKEHGHGTCSYNILNANRTIKRHPKILLIINTMCVQVHTVIYKYSVHDKKPRWIDEILVFDFSYAKSLLIYQVIQTSSEKSNIIHSLNHHVINHKGN